jgi:hypothetical protein
MTDEVAFELKAGVREAAVTVAGGKTVRVKKGKKLTTSDPNEISALDNAEGVKRAARRKRATSTSKATATKRAKRTKAVPAATTSTSGASSSAEEN